MRKPPLISVLVPSYNHERYVENAVRSVLSQDWPRVELIVVDDGSTDATWDVLLRLRPECEAGLERVVLERQENCGTCTTLNRLRAHARGEFVTFLASDDAFLPGAFSALASAMLADGRLSLAVGQNEIMDDEGRTCYWDEARNVVYDPAAAAYRTLNEQMAKTSGISGAHPEFGAYRRLLRQNHVANGALIRRASLDRAGPCLLQAPLEDWWIVLQLAKVGAMAELARPTFRYRWHATNAVKANAIMADCYALNLEEEERRLVASRDWRHLEIYLAEWSRPDDCRKGLFGATTRRMTTGFASLRLRRILGFRKVTRKELSYGLRMLEDETPAAAMSDVRERGMAGSRLLVRPGTLLSGDAPSRARLARAFEDGTLGLLAAGRGADAGFAVRPIVVHQAFRRRRLAPDMTWNRFLACLAQAAGELGRAVRGWDV